MSVEAPQLLPDEARTAAKTQKDGGEHQLLQDPVRQKRLKMKRNESGINTAELSVFEIYKPT